MDKQTRYLLFLNYIFYDTPSRFHEILSQFPTQSSIDKNISSFINSLSEPKKKRYSFIKNQINTVIKQLNKLQVGIITYHHSKYPFLLKEIHNPPPLLYYKGDINLLQNTCFSVVGTRTPSSYGKEITTLFTQELCPHFTIVSGLAAGIDAIAHQTCLKFNHPTIAIIGTGINLIYPSHHRELHELICENGLILSEFPIDTKGFSHHFPQRNRLISGISKGTLVCEGKHKSGSLITANFALEQNRDVFAIPGSIFSKLSEGPNKLIQEGAKLCHKPQDIFEEYGIKSTNNKHANSIKSKDLNETEIIILSQIQSQKNTLEYLLKTTSLPLSQLLQILSALELKKFISRQQDHSYVCIKEF